MKRVIALLFVLFSALSVPGEAWADTVRVEGTPRWVRIDVDDTTGMFRAGKARSPDVAHFSLHPDRTKAGMLTSRRGGHFGVLVWADDDKLYTHWVIYPRSGPMQEGGDPLP